MTAVGIPQLLTSGVTSMLPPGQPFGRRPWTTPELPAVLQEEIRTRPGRQTYHLARLAFSESGINAWPVSTTGSGDVLALSRANGFVVTSPDTDRVDAGASVTVVPWNLP